MRLNRNICGVAAVLSLLLILSTSVFSQDLPAVTGGEGSPLSMLDDLTSSLLADDQVLSHGTDMNSSLFEDLSTTGGSSGDVIKTETEPPPPSTDDPAAPIDGGLSLLLAAGTAYGARRLRHRKHG